MNTAIIIITLVMSFLNLGLIFLLYRTVGSLDKGQVLLRKVFTEIWNKQKTYENSLAGYNKSFENISKELLAYRMDGTESKILDTISEMQGQYSDYYDSAITVLKDLNRQLDDLSGMTGDIWWATDLNGDDEIDEQDLEFADELLDILDGIDTGIDGIEEGLLRKYGEDLNTGYLVGPLHLSVDRIRQKINAAKEKYDGNEDTLSGRTDELDEVPGVCEGTQEEGLGREEDRAESWDEYDEVQEAPESGEDDGEAGSGEY